MCANYTSTDPKASSTRNMKNTRRSTIIKSVKKKNRVYEKFKAVRDKVVFYIE